MSLDALQDHQTELEGFIGDFYLRSVVLFVLAYTLLVAISFPGASFLTIASGFLFGLWVGTGVVVVGATAGAVLLYLAARTVFGDSLRRRAGGFVAKMRDGFAENELSYMFILRLVPLFPFWAVNIAGGVAGVRLRNYTLGTLLGIIPGSFVYVSIGNGIAAGVADAGDLSLGALLTQPEIVLPLIGLIALALVPVAYRSLRRRGGRAAGNG
nr:VTT domain-containing protein [Parvularcula dongshanensis]